VKRGGEGCSCEGKQSMSSWFSYQMQRFQFLVGLITRFNQSLGSEG
jgi:hypothetical protein